jgi:hypothetical protein
MNQSKSITTNSIATPNNIGARKSKSVSNKLNETSKPIEITSFDVTLSTPLLTIR